MREGPVSGFDPTTPVNFTMREILSAGWFVIAAAMTVIGSRALGVWAVVSFAIAGTRDDVKSVRDSVHALQAANKASAVSLQDAQNRLTDRIAKLDNSSTTDAKLDAIITSIEALSKRVESIAQSGPGDERRKRR